MFRILFVCALIAWPQAASAKLNVVTTTPDLAAVASEVGGERVTVVALADANEDPHYVDPKPSLILPLNRADILILNGLELEVGWLPPLITQSRNARIQPGAPGYFDASGPVPKLSTVTGKIDRSMGDIHPGGNPHYTLSPLNMARVVQALGKRMGELDPAHAAEYASRSVTFAEELELFGKRASERFRALPQSQRQVVSYHASLIYFENWLGLEEVATIEPRPGIPPTPAHVAKVLKTMRQRGARVILQEKFYPAKTSQTLGKLAKVPVVVFNAGTRFSEGERYLEHLQHIEQELYDALSR